MEAQSSTINIRGQRKVVAIEYHKEFAFKIPDGIDMEDKNVVQRYFVKWDKLHIVYADKDKQPDIIEIDWKTYDDELNIPNDMRIADADEYGLEYSEDEKEEIQPTTYQCDICNHHLEDWEKGTCNDCFYGDDQDINDCVICNKIFKEEPYKVDELNGDLLTFCSAECYKKGDEYVDNVMTLLKY